MKYFVIIFIIAGFLSSPFVISQSFAQCTVNEDWPQAPCLDVILNECYDSEDVKIWMTYPDYKGESFMESKRAEMINAIEENRLKEWESQSHKNSNVWQYYYLKGEIPNFVGVYYPCTEQLNTNGSLRIQMNQSVLYDDYEIIFSEVLEDSRCPVDVTCIWEGQASTKIDFIGDTKIQEIILSTRDKTTAHFDSYEINLLGVLPFPVSTKIISLEEYTTIISISKRDKENTQSPLKQIRSGISLNEIKCKDNLVVIQKYDDSPVCVKKEHVTKFFQRGWMISDSLLDYSMKNSKLIEPFWDKELSFTSIDSADEIPAKFDLKLPSYVPDGYKITGYNNNNNGNDAIMQVFISPKSSEGNTIYDYFWKDNGIEITYIENSNPAVDPKTYVEYRAKQINAKHVDLAGYDGYLLPQSVFYEESLPGLIPTMPELHTHYDRIFVHINGNVSDGEIVLIGKSIFDTVSASIDKSTCEHQIHNNKPPKIYNVTPTSDGAIVRWYQALKSSTE